MWLAQNVDTYTPPCPSNTANKNIYLLNRWNTIESYMFLRQPKLNWSHQLPCISEVTTRILLCWYIFVFLVVIGWERNAPPIFYIFSEEYLF